MDPYSETQYGGNDSAWTDHLTGKTALDPRWEPIRKSMGYTLRYASKMDMASAKPHNDLASTKYCLASPGVDYLVYLPDGGEVIVDLSAASGTLAVEWFNPNTGETVAAGAIAGGAEHDLEAPFEGDAVLHIAKH